MIALTLDTSQATQTLELAIERMGDLTGPLTEVLTSFLADAVASIEMQGTAFGDGDAWAPMAALTPIVALKLYGETRVPGTLLEASGALARSLVPGEPGNVLEVGPTEGIAGTALRSERTGFSIGRGQQDGTSRTFHVLQGQGFSAPGIPPRRFLAWHDSRFEEYRGIFARHILPGAHIP